jgi:hypothetical protein
MAFPQNAVLDDFNRANQGPPPSTNWSILHNGVDAGKVVSNQWAANGNPSCGYWNPTSFGPDQEVYCSLPVRASDGQRFDLNARVQGTLASQNGYVLRLNPAAGAANDAITIRRITNGSTTTLKSFTQEVSNGDGLGLTAIGSVLTALYKPSGGAWGILGSYDTVNDATKYTAGGFIGFECNLDSSIRMDDFGGGNVVANANLTNQKISIITGNLSASKDQNKTSTVLNSLISVLSNNLSASKVAVKSASLSQAVIRITQNNISGAIGVVIKSASTITQNISVIANNLTVTATREKTSSITKTLINITQNNLSSSATKTKTAAVGEVQINIVLNNVSVAIPVAGQVSIVLLLNSKIETFMLRESRLETTMNRKSRIDTALLKESEIETSLIKKSRIDKTMLLESLL